MDAVFLKVNWSGSVTDPALLVAIGVNEQGFREVLAVEAAGGERKEAYRNLLKGLIDRGLRGMELVISDDHESIKQAVKIELSGTSWQRCEMTVGDIIAATIFQAAMNVPGRVIPDDAARRAAAERGEATFAQIGCTDCHVPTMMLNSCMFSEPNPFNPTGNLRP